MGNVGSNGSGRRRHRSHEPQTQGPPPEAAANRFTYQAQYPNPQPYFHYPGYYPPTLYPHQFRAGGVFPGPVNWAGPGGPEFHCGAAHHHPAPYVDHQKAMTIRNDVNVKKESLRVEPDEENPGRFLVAFTFDATAPGSITVMFFAKEDAGCKHVVTKESLLKEITVPFDQGLGQKFRQPAGTGIEFSMFDETELTKRSDSEVYPLVVKAEAHPSKNGEQESSAGNSQITLAVFEKDKGQYQVRVMKQILWVDKTRYELQEIYGIGNTVEGDYEGNDTGKECVICLSEPRDTTVLPCRHMCMCSGCAKVLRFQTDRCPICRQPVERLLEIKVNNGPEGVDPRPLSEIKVNNGPEGVDPCPLSNNSAAK